MDSLSRPLPIAFRIRQTTPAPISSSLKSELSASLNLTPVPYDHTQTIYQTSEIFNKASIRRGGPEYDHPVAEFIRDNLTKGYIARQEIVSMVKPLSINSLQ